VEAFHEILIIIFDPWGSLIVIFKRIGVGGLVGLIVGPGAVLMAGAGAIIGGLAAKLSDSGFDNQDLKELAKSRKPGSSALLVLVEQDHLSLVG
jgi:uncharacterized membrane protein